MDIKNKKILFLGFGAVAKGVYHYLKDFFIYDKHKVYIVDKCKNTIPKSKNVFNECITSSNFDKFINKIGLKHKDIIIDLTCNSNTYYFIKRCFELGINYINTSIEDNNDEMLGTSIHLQQQKVLDIFNEYLLRDKHQAPKNNKIRCNVLTEFGQNPGLIQHYILYLLNELNKRYYNTIEDNYDIEHLKKAIDNYQIGIIYLSEIDTIKAKKIKKDIIYNTWSVGGFLSEAFDRTELVCGKENFYVKPIIKEKKEYIDENVYLLKDVGINYQLKSVVPILKNNKIKFIEYEGALIHHGEIFELAKLFGDKTPFMSYVYKFNKHLKQSIQDYVKKNGYRTENNLKLLVNEKCDSYKVFNNISNKTKGEDSVGCVVMCGKDKVEKMFWCGSVLESEDSDFTPTIIQVCAGVLSGLSWMLEKENENLGLLSPCDLDTKYILEKSVKMLGKFFIAEIDNKVFSGDLKLKTQKLI